MAIPFPASVEPSPLRRSGFWCKHRSKFDGNSKETAAVVLLVELSLLGDRPREEALAKRAVWNQADPEFRERRQYFFLRTLPPKRKFTLKRSHRLSGMCPANGLCPCLGQAEMLYLTLLNQILHRSSHIFDWHLRVNAVLIEQVDRVHSQSLQRALHSLFDVFRPAVQTSWMRIFLGFESEPEFRRDNHLLTKRSERFAHELFIRERSVDLSRIKQCDAALDGSPDDPDHLFLGPRYRAVTGAQPHAAKSDGRDFQFAVSKLPILHGHSS